MEAQNGISSVQHFSYAYSRLKFRCSVEMKQKLTGGKSGKAPNCHMGFVSKLLGAHTDPPKVSETQFFCFCSIHEFGSLLHQYWECLDSCQEKDKVSVPVTIQSINKLFTVGK